RRHSAGDPGPAVWRSDQHHGQPPAAPGWPGMVAEHDDAIGDAHPHVPPQVDGYARASQAERPVDGQACDARQWVHAQYSASWTRVPARYDRPDLGVHRPQQRAERPKSCASPYRWSYRPGEGQRLVAPAINLIDPDVYQRGGPPHDQLTWLR